MYAIWINDCVGTYEKGSHWVTYYAKTTGGSTNGKTVRQTDRPTQSLSDIPASTLMISSTKQNPILTHS